MYKGGLLAKNVTEDIHRKNDNRSLRDP